MGGDVGKERLDMLAEVVRRHAAVRERLVVLEEALQEIEAGETTACAHWATRLEELVRFFTEDVCDLLKLEEEVLFPPVARDLSEIGGPVAALHMEHEEVRRVIHEFARSVLQWSQGEPDRASRASDITVCAVRLRDLLRLHLEKEEAVLFRVIPKVFARADRRKAAARLRARSKRGTVLILVMGGIGAMWAGGVRAQDRARPTERRLIAHGEVRIRWEGRWGQLLGRGVEARSRDGYVLTRVRIGLEGRPAPWMRIFVQGQDAQALGFQANPDPPIVEDTFDLRQAYVEVFDQKRQGWGFQLGRQELRFGDERLVGVFDWGNTARSFDAVRVFYAQPRYRVDAFAASVVVIREGAFNTHRAGENLHGVYGSFRMGSGTVGEGYWLWRTQPHVIGERGERGDADIFTLGTRWVGTLLPRLAYRVEVATQWGQWARDRIRAHAGHAQLQYQIGAAGLSPRVLLEYNQASGDRDPRDGRRQTFDQLYPTNHDKYGIADVVGWRNMRHLRLGLGLRLGPRAAAQVDYHTFWLISPRDALYAAGGAPIARLHRAELTPLPTHVGHEVDVDIRVPLSRAVSFSAGYAHLFPGRFLTQAAPGATISFAYAMVSYRF